MWETSSKWWIIFVHLDEDVMNVYARVCSIAPRRVLKDTKVRDMESTFCKSLQENLVCHKRNIVHNAVVSACSLCISH